MFTKKSSADVKKSTLKIQDFKKDSNSRLRHLKTILENVDIEEAKSLFEANYSTVYFILYDTFVQAEANLRQRVHKAHREELDGSLWLLGKILCLLPELIARRWQCHSVSRILSKLLHYGNTAKLRREGVKFFLLWYQALGENAPPQMHTMFTELVPGLIVPLKGIPGPSSTEEYGPNDLLNHPNMRGEMGASVFHDTGAHPVKSPEISPLLPPSSHEKSSPPDPKDGLEILLDCMYQSTGCLKWRDNSPQRHMKCFQFLLQRFRETYIPVFCPGFDNFTSVYDPKLDLPVMRIISRREEIMSPCVVVVVNWLSKFTLDRPTTSRIDIHIEDDVGEHASLLSNLRIMNYSQNQLVRDVLYSNRDNINFVHEVLRQAFLMGFSSKAQVEAMRIAIAVYRDWMHNVPPPFLLEPEEGGLTDTAIGPKNQRLRTDSYLGAIYKENLVIRAGLQNVLQTFVTHAANAFMVQTAHLNQVFPTKNREMTTPLEEQTDICKRVLNIYRTMVMNTRMDSKSWEQLLLVLLQITSVILTNVPPNSKKNNLGGRLAQAVFQTLIVTWIRAHTNVQVNSNLWDKFLNVLSSLTHREELIIEWDKTMHTLTRVMARQVYNLNLQDLPLDRLAEQKGKRRRIASSWNQTPQQSLAEGSISISSNKNDTEMTGEVINQPRSIPGTPSLNRSYSEGSLAPYKKSRGRRRLKNSQRVSALPSNVEHSLNRFLSNTPVHISISSDTLNNSRISQHGGSGTLRRALSLDSIRPNVSGDGDEFNSRSPSPTASSSGIESGSIKDSPMQIDVMTADSSSIDTQEDGTMSADRRSILAGGYARGWMPDVAAVMWKRMLGALGDVNKILNPKLHAQVFKYLVEITEILIKIKLNQGISNDNLSTPAPPILVPPVGIIAPWCYGALALESQFREGKLQALQILCTIAKHSTIGNDQLPLFYHALHRALTGEDRAMAYTVLQHLGGSRFLSLLLPGHTLLFLDLVHASTVVLTSSDTSNNVPRSEVAGLLGSLLCFPKTSLPKPVLQPSEPNVDLMECPDLQDHVLNIVLRCARREPTSKARCIAIASLGQWIIQNLTNPINFQQSFSQNIPQVGTKKSRNFILNPRITEAIQVILQALQFKHRVIARVAAETLKICAEKGKQIAKIERLPQLIINAICVALEIQNVTNPKDSDKIVLTSLILTLGEFCMSIPTKLLLKPLGSDNDKNLITYVLKILHEIGSGKQTDRIKLFTADEDFDMTITLDDVKENSSSDASYQTAETILNCVTAIKLCAKTVSMNLVTNLSHFPMGIGASRMSSLVDEQDDLTLSTLTQSRESSVELNTIQALTAPNLQMFLLSDGLVASFIELPMLKLPGGGCTHGLITANRQVRVLLRDLSGKACWDASILYKEPNIEKSDDELTKCLPKNLKNENSDYQLTSSSIERQQFFSEKSSYIGRSYQQQQQTGRFIGTSLDPLTSTIGLPVSSPRHTLRHRPPNQLPLAKDLAPDLDQLDDLLQYIGFTSPECLNAIETPLNTPGQSPLGSNIEGHTISVILNQKAIEQDFAIRQNVQSAGSSKSKEDSLSSSGSNESKTTNSKDLLPFQFCRLLFSQLGLAGWERRKRTHLLNRTDKLLRELRNLDTQKCRETHKMAVIYVGSGQEDKNSILRNSSGSSTYEMFVSALGWEVELESHNGFLGGLPRTGCGSTAPYYATPFLEVIYHVATRMPTDTPEAILNKTRHLGNDEVHIVWSENNRDYRRDILPTEFCDVLIVVYPLRSGLFRVTVNRKPEVPWFGPVWNESVISGACLASLVRATAINASRAKRSSLPFYQQFYEERSRSLETISTRHKENSTFEEFAARIFNPIQPQSTTSSSNIITTAVAAAAPLASALIDHHRSSTKSWIQHPEMSASAREVSQQTIAMATIALDHPSPRPLRKLHPFKSVPKRTSLQHQQSSGTHSPDSPTLPGRKFK